MQMSSQYVFIAMFTKPMSGTFQRAVSNVFIQDSEGAQESIPGLYKRLQIQAQLVKKIKIKHVACRANNKLKITYIMLNFNRTSFLELSE
jgi:hypothetical protein